MKKVVQLRNQNPGYLVAFMVCAARYEKVGYDPVTGEYNATLLAEHTAYEYNHPEWLDDDTHMVWDAAVDAIDSLAS